MANRAHFTPSRQSSGGRTGAGSGNSEYGRVIKTVLTLNDPDCIDPSYLNGVYYRPTKIAADESIVEGKKFAYQGNSAMRVIPMEGEIVQIESAPGASSVGNPSITTKYWTKIINVWNSPHHNALPDTSQQGWEDRLIGGSNELSNINPLQAAPGDTLIEGRLGQSIRFGGSKGGDSLISLDFNDGSPLIVISNGQIETDNGIDPIFEDVNKDNNSMYFAANHNIPLNAANKKRVSYDVPPITPLQYYGNQVVVNGGRLFFNAKEESAFISAMDSIGLNANTVNIDAEEYFCVDAKKIFLGVKARTSTIKEPVILGIQLENWLRSLLSIVSTIGVAFKTAESVTGGPVVELNTAGPQIMKLAVLLEKTLIKMQSTKVYTE